MEKASIQSNQLRVNQRFHFVLVEPPLSAGVLEVEAICSVFICSRHKWVSPCSGYSAVGCQETITIKDGNSNQAVYLLTLNNGA